MSCRIKIEFFGTLPSRFRAMPKKTQFFPILFPLVSRHDKFRQDLHSGGLVFLFMFLHVLRISVVLFVRLCICCFPQVMGEETRPHFEMCVGVLFCLDVCVSCGGRCSCRLHCQCLGSGHRLIFFSEQAV